MTGRQHSTSKIRRILGMRLLSQPVRRMDRKQSAPSGNWKSIDCSVEYPNVLTIRGPKPLTAPLTVYAAAIMSAMIQILASKAASFICDGLRTWHRTPVWPFRRRSTAMMRSSGVRNQAETAELGIDRQTKPNRIVSAPARR